MIRGLYYYPARRPPADPTTAGYKRSPYTTFSGKGKTVVLITMKPRKGGNEVRRCYTEIKNEGMGFYWKLQDFVRNPVILIYTIVLSFSN